MPIRRFLTVLRGLFERHECVGVRRHGICVVKIVSIDLVFLELDLRGPVCLGLRFFRVIEEMGWILWKSIADLQQPNEQTLKLQPPPSSVGKKKYPSSMSVKPKRCSRVALRYATTMAVPSSEEMVR